MTRKEDFLLRVLALSLLLAAIMIAWLLISIVILGTVEVWGEIHEAHSG